MYTENIVAVHPLGLDTLRVRYYCILRPNTSETELNYLAEKHSFLEHSHIQARARLCMHTQHR